MPGGASLCEHVFVISEEGSDYGRFQRAIAAGNGPAAYAAASDLGTMQLADALSLTLLLVGQGELFERCAGRWLSRFGGEVSGLRVQDCALVAVALQAVGSGSVAGASRSRSSASSAGGPTSPTWSSGGCRRGASSLTPAPCFDGRGFDHRRFQMAGRVPGSAVLALLAVALAAPSGAFACSCVPVDAKKQLSKADGAVIGRIIGSVPVGEFEADYELRIREVFKGRGIQPKRNLVVRSGANGGLCGIEDFGEPTGFFLRRVDNRWESSLCAQTSRRALRKAAGGRGRQGKRAGCGATA